MRSTMSALRAVLCAALLVACMLLFPHGDSAAAEKNDAFLLKQCQTAPTLGEHDEILELMEEVIGCIKFLDDDSDRRYYYVEGVFALIDYEFIAEEIVGRFKWKRSISKLQQDQFLQTQTT